MAKKRFFALILLVLGVAVGYFDYASEVSKYNPKPIINRPFRLGLDLSGGSQLVYRADVSALRPADVSDAMASLKEVIDRRVNALGVTEPVIQVEQSSLSGTSTHKLIVELPGVTDVKEAESMINRTPKLEFKTVRPDGPEKEAIKAAIAQVEKAIGTTTSPMILAQLSSVPGIATETLALAKQNPDFADTDVNGGLLKRAAVEFSQQSIDPSISIEFTSDGRDKFAKLTEANVGKPLAIFLDGEMISAPNVKEPIRDGRAIISGRFTVAEAKSLARDLNLGALPVPIVKESVQTIGATLGSEALDKGVRAGIISFLIIAIFMIIWYRLPGLVASVSLSIYVVIMLAIFKLIPITLTAAGIAGFILSIGIAVDANVLIFERMKEELKNGKKIQDAIEHGFSRAWTSIRDSNFSTIISSLILFWFGSSLIRGFGLNLALGVIVSMFTALTVTRTFLMAMGLRGDNKLVRFLFSNGLTVVKKVENN